MGFTAHAFDQVLPRPVEELRDGVGLSIALKPEAFKRAAVEVKAVDDLALPFGQLLETDLEQLPFTRFLPLALEMPRLDHLHEVCFEEWHRGSGGLFPAFVAVMVQSDGPHPGDKVRTILKSTTLFPGGEVGELQQIPGVRKITCQAHEEPENRDLGPMQSGFKRGIRFLWQSVHSMKGCFPGSILYDFPTFFFPCLAAMMVAEKKYTHQELNLNLRLRRPT